MIGVISLFLSILFAGLAFYKSLRAWLQKRTAPPKDICYQLAASFILISSGCLLYAIFTDAFQYKYVWSFSARAMQPFYKLAAFWAGQEGSFLLWLCVHAVIGLLLQRRQASFPAMFIVWQAIQLFLAALLLLHNPFILQGFTPPDGNGLNDLLQNFWMVIHPPIIFISYVLLSVPFAYAMGALIEQPTNDNWLKPTAMWGRIGFAFLGLGIAVGSYWAYETLGWGGYWGWDPVENASLLPWLTTAALLHFIAIARHKKAALRGVFFCAVATFDLIIFGTYITRSGALSDFSVHAFGAADQNQLFFYLTLFILHITLLYLAKKWSRIPHPDFYQQLSEPAFLLAAGAISLLSLCALILLGVATPLFTRMLGQIQSVDAAFYMQCAKPLSLVWLLLLLAFLAGRSSQRQFSLRLLAGAAFIPGLLLCYSYEITDPLAALLVITGAAVVIGHIVNRPLRNMAMNTAHCGLGLLICGIVISGNGTQTVIDASPNTVFEWRSVQLSYAPTAQTQACIYSTLSGDYYMTPQENSQQPEIAAVRLALLTPQEHSGTTYTLQKIAKHKQNNELAFTAELTVAEPNTPPTAVTLTMQHQNGSFSSSQATLPVSGQTIAIQRLNPQSEQLTISIAEPVPQEQPQINISWKPLIILLWLGGLLLSIATLLPKK